MIRRKLPFVESSLLLCLHICNLKLFRYNDGRYDVSQEAASKTADGQDDPYETDDGWIDVKVFADSSAYAANHFVGS